MEVDLHPMPILDWRPQGSVTTTRWWTRTALYRYLNQMNAINADATCALCAALLDARNRSKEHVIPNAIGGRLTTQTFICAACNNTHGHAWDAELARQTNWFSSSLGITRHRGEVPKERVQTIDGTGLWLRSDGTMAPEHPRSEVHETDGKVTIQIVARNIDEAHRMLKAARRKFPSIDVEKAKQEMEVKDEFLSSPLHVQLQIGGPEACRSIVKTALAYASTCGVPHLCCDAALGYLQHIDSPSPFGFAYTFEFVKARPSETVLHCVGLMGDPKRGILLSYIEYFGHFRFLVRLATHYSGEPVNASYAIDPVSGKEEHIDLDWNISDDQIRAIVDGTADVYPGMMKAAHHIIPIVLKRNEDRQRQRVIVEAFEYAAVSLGFRPGDAIPTAHSERFVALMMEKLSPYLHHLVARSNRPPALSDADPFWNGPSSQDA
ncbi:conserved hypothetical protein [Cupriavidus taiwanensis]|nr:conserved hypothetical protein [Cupriavidus taiwanensis]